MSVPEVQAALAQYRDVREQIEAAILPLATSVDGRRFNYQASLHGLELEAGGYVTIETAAGPARAAPVARVRQRRRHRRRRLPQVRDPFRPRRGRRAGGRGRPFHDARCGRRGRTRSRPGSSGARPRRARSPVGELALAPGVPFALDAGGFGRHTFLCGQSGSGKTYSLGVLLERLLMETTLRVVVLDPNSDYVRLGEARARADAERGGALCRRGAGSVAVRSGVDGAERHARALPRAEPARSRRPLLRLDPLADREEYAELVALSSRTRALRSVDGPRGATASEALRLRARNLGVDRLGHLAGARRPARSLEELEDPMARAAWWSTSARWRRARSRRSRPAPCSSGSGAAARAASRSRS